MRTPVLAELVAARVEQAGLAVSNEARERLLVYLELLARWNRKVNLTGFDLDRPTADAVDRLILEPIQALADVRATDRTGVDIGSGGGSPAIPLLVCAPQLEMVLVEVREKKGAFLREVIRSVGVTAEVAVCRVEDYSRRAQKGDGVDLVTMRAVKATPGIWSSVERLMSHGGRMLLFGQIGCMPEKLELRLLYSTARGVSVLERQSGLR